MSKRLKIFFHDNCFDGAASAAVFADFYRACVDRGASVIYQGVQHMRGDPFAGHAIDGDDNACVDFRYSEKMSWWFDHHVSAFQPPERRDHFETTKNGQKFFDPTARSCTKFQADILRERFGWTPSPGFNDLITWADMIDSAQFANPEQAVALAEPSLLLMTWIEHNGSGGRANQLIELLGHRPFEELVALPWINEPLQPLLKEHRQNIDLVKKSAVFEGGIVYFDLAGTGVSAHNKFISYYWYPDARYTIGVTQSPQRVKISVGCNPWAPEKRMHDIASICERYGGGGHPFVGAVTIPGDQLERGREIAAAIREELTI